MKTEAVTPCSRTRLALLRMSIAASMILSCGYSQEPIADAVSAGETKPPANVYYCRTSEEIRKTAAALLPGDSLVVRDGTYRDVHFQITAKGSPGKKITIEAENPGKVTLTGAVKVVLDGEHTVLRGFYITDGSGLYHEKDGKYVRRLPGGNLWTVLSLGGNHNLISECAVNEFDKHTLIPCTSVAFTGRHNRVDRCAFMGNWQGCNTVLVDIIEDIESEISNCYFSRPRIRSGSASVIRIGTGHGWSVDVGFKVTGNLFERCEGEGEVISDKTSRNVHIGNTYRTNGRLSMRQGGRTTVMGNYFIGSGVSGNGFDCVIANNYAYWPVWFPAGGMEMRGKLMNHNPPSYRMLYMNNTIIGQGFGLGGIPHGQPEALQGRKLFTPSDILCLNNVVINPVAEPIQLWTGREAIKVDMGMDKRRITLPVDYLKYSSDEIDELYKTVHFDNTYTFGKMESAFFFGETGNSLRIERWLSNVRAFDDIETHFDRVESGIDNVHDIADLAEPPSCYIYFPKRSSKALRIGAGTRLTPEQKKIWDSIDNEYRDQIFHADLSGQARSREVYAGCFDPSTERKLPLQFSDVGPTWLKENPNAWARGEVTGLESMKVFWAQERERKERRAELGIDN